MGNPPDGRVDHYAFRLLFAYAWHLALTRQRQQEFFDILIGCHNFDERNGVLNGTEKIMLLGFLIDAGMASLKYLKVIEYANKLLSFPSIPLLLKEHCLLSLGNASHKIGQYEKAGEYFERSLKISKGLRDKLVDAHACVGLGTVYREVGEYKKAVDFLERALKISKDIRDVVVEGNAHSTLGSVYCTIGQYKEAQDNLERALHISKDLMHNTMQTGRNYKDLANVYRDVGENKKALDYYERALKISKEVGDIEGEQRVCSCLGTIYRKVGEFKKAIDCHKRSLEIVRDLGDIRGEGQSCANLGNVYNDIGEYEKSLRYQKRGLEICGECGDIGGVMRSCHSLGHTYCRIGQYAVQCRYLCQSISVSDSLRKDFKKRDQFNMSMAKLNFDTHKLLMIGLLNLKHIKKALLVLDVGRSKSLFDLLRLSSSAINEQLLESQSIKWIEEIPSMIDDPKRDSHADISANVCRSLQDGSVVLFGFDQYDNLLIWVLTQEETFLREWSPTRSRTARIFFAKLLTGLRDVVTAPRRPNLGLEDVRDDSRERKTEAFYELPDEIEKANSKAGRPCKELSEKEPNEARKTEDVDVEFGNFGREAEQNPKATSRGGDSQQAEMQVTRMLTAGYQALIAPVEHLLTGSKLIIVPADSLFLLPFSALLDRDGKSLCDRFSIQITPALHTLNLSLSIPVKPLGPALCIGNPTVGKVFFQSKVVDVPPLPGAEDEAAECAAYFEAKPLLNKQATKKKVLERMKNASVVHIAAHGNMAYGEIFLAANPKAPSPPKEEHYLLMPEDIAKCSLSARLVVLSCCHSGRGEISSEGVAGTARAFLGAGARAVLVALWALPDKETRAFMKLFYENVCKGLSVCVALQQAMRTFKEGNDRVGAWAPFEIFGEDVTISSKDLEKIRRLSREYKV